MPEDMTVWAVELVAGSPQAERKGVLSLDERTLRFTPDKEGQTTFEIPLRQVVRARRLRGSPVLLVERRAGTGVARTAFYFVQPPPLEAFLGRETGRNVLTTLRNPKRKARRENVGYLGVTNREKKAVVIEWERAVREAVEIARNA